MVPRRQRRGAAGKGRVVAALVLSACSAVAIAFCSARQPGSHRRLLGARRLEVEHHIIARAAEVAEAEVDEADVEEVVSPFAQDVNDVRKRKETLPLTWENVEMVLDELRPYLRSDGGDCKIAEIDGPIIRLELQGSCQSCSSSSVTLKMGIEKTLKERIPEIAEVNAVLPDQEPISRAGVEEVLNGIRPFLSVSGGSIEISELVEGMNPQLQLMMSGPPLKSTAVRVEVVNRIKRKYALLQDVDIVGDPEDGDSA